jgi:adenylate cyclase
MSSLLHSSIGLLRSRLSRQIVAWVFLSLLVIEAIIFVPSYYRRQRERLRGLETVSTEVLFTIKAATMGDMATADLLTLMQQQLRPDSVILGGALFDLQGNVLSSFGEAPQLDLPVPPADQILRQYRSWESRYDVAWPPQEFQEKYVLVVRHNASTVQRSMVLYALAIGGLVVIISLFVTLATILVLERLLINPLLHLREDLLAAGDAVSRDEDPDFYSLSLRRQDELGDVAKAFGQMFHRVQHEIWERKQAEAALLEEQEKAERLLLNVLPSSIVDQLKRKSGAIASRFDEATILFADIVDFTGLATRFPPTELVQLLNEIFSTFDCMADRLGLEKIKTIGDAYMVVGGLPLPCDDHAERAMNLALEMLQAIEQFQRDDGQPFSLRIGINTGPVVAGVIGIKRFSYDLWGDAVNVASRMESHGLANRIQVSEATYKQLKHLYPFESRGDIDVKGRGSMKTYLYNGPLRANTSANKDSKAP